MQTDGCVCVLSCIHLPFFFFLFCIVSHWLSDIYCDPDNNDTSRSNYQVHSNSRGGGGGGARGVLFPVITVHAGLFRSHLLTVYSYAKVCQKLCNVKL